MTATRSEVQSKLTSIIASLRAKKRDLNLQYQDSNRKLMRSFDISTKEEISKFALEENKLRQTREVLEQVLRDAFFLNQNISAFYKNYDSPPYCDRYCSLLESSKILENQDIERLGQMLTPKKQIKISELRTLTEKEIGPYVKKFAEDKGSSQGADERLMELFRPPKAEMVHPSPKRESTD